MVFRLLAVAVTLVALAVSPALADKIALVIGNGAYSHTAPLRNPANDSADIADALEAAGFDVTRQQDLTQIALLKALQEFKNRSLGAEVAIIYYAGHGIEIDRQNFLIPVDAVLARDTDIPFEAIPLDAAIQAVSAASDLSLVIVDACRNNPFLTSIARTDSTRSMSRGLALVEPAGNTLVAYAAREGTVALDGQGRNSPYAAALKSAINEPGLEIGQLFRRVRDDVIERTSGAQEPFVYGSLSSKAIYLNPADEAPEPAVAAPATPGLPSEDSVELAIWSYVSNSDDVQDFRDYLDRYPEGRFASFARRRIAEFETAAAAPPAPETPAEDGSRLIQVVPGGEETRPDPPLVVAPEAPVTETPEAPPFRATRDDIALVQGSLNALGRDAGPVDGLFGRRTAAAISEYQVANSLPVTGEISAPLMEALAAELAARGLEPEAPPVPPAAAPTPAPGTTTAGATAVQPRQPDTRFAPVSTGLYCESVRKSPTLRRQDCLEITSVGPSTVTTTRMDLLIKDGRREARYSETLERTPAGFGTVTVINSNRIRFRNRFYDTRNALF